MRKTFISIFMSIFLNSCGDAGPSGNVENPEDQQQCTTTWWYFEEDGSIILEGNEAGFTIVPGDIYGTPDITYLQGYFSDTINKIPSRQSCTFLSQQDLSEGIHDNLTCIIDTNQGPNPQWIGAETGSDGDHRPVLTSIKYNGEYVSGTFQGTMFRLDTISISPPNIQGRVVNYKFEFNALNNKKFTNQYEICGPKCSLDGLGKYCRDSGCSFTDSGGSHAKCKNSSGKLVTTIPRHNKVADGTCKSIIKAIDNGCP